MRTKQEKSFRRERSAYASNDLFLQKLKKLLTNFAKRYILNNVDRGAVFISSAEKGAETPRVKGNTAEILTAFPRCPGWDTEQYSVYCHLLWRAINGFVWVLLPQMLFTVFAAFSVLKNK